MTSENRTRNPKVVNFGQLKERSGFDERLLAKVVGDDDLMWVTSLLPTVNWPEIPGSKPDPAQRILRRLFDQWFIARTDPAAMKELLEELNKYQGDWQRRLIAQSDGGISEEITFPSDANQAEILLVWQFVEVIKGRYAKDILKCPQCGLVFLNSSGHRNKVYCSAKCAQYKTAIEATNARRQREQERKIEIARRLFDRIDEKPAGKDWKEWIVRKAGKKSGITLWWLTRAINSKLLPESPPKLSATRRSKG